ncbi:hypothetical protein l13_09570 [Neisseria weaveri ATCC 51223]|nr:hypothetical protein l13_09570 [Neisseria weaveri ATCC 51223]
MIIVIKKSLNLLGFFQKKSPPQLSNSLEIGYNKKAFTSILC